MHIDITALQKSEADYLANTPNTIYAPGKSIVTTCFDSGMTSTWVMLSELKRLGCDLPVEIFYKDDELTDRQKELLVSVMPGKISIRKIVGSPKVFTSKYGHKHGWACKIYALYESRYAENLWIDNDNYPISDPTILFSDVEYVEKGSLFWRDMLSVDSANQYADTSPMWQIFNIPINDAEPFEAGQLIINKMKCPVEFKLLKYYADNCDIYYQFGGDKETFKFAWMRAAYMNGAVIFRVNYHSGTNIPFGFMPYGPFSKGVQNQQHKWGGGSVMVQRDRKGKEIFNHRNINKINSNMNVFNSDITNEELYHAYAGNFKRIAGVSDGR
jgi:alpha 1,2-mannosyltransferase